MVPGTCPKGAPTMLLTATPAAPFTWQFYQDPYPTYAWLREHHPVYRTTMPPTDVPIWLVSRHNDVCDVMVDHVRFSASPNTATAAYRATGESVETSHV